jgi:hypothetical protein
MKTNDYPWGEGKEAPTMLHAAAEVIFSGGNQPMHYMDIWQEIVKRAYYTKSAGKTPWHSLRVLMSKAPDRFVYLHDGLFQLVVPKSVQ